MLGGGIRETHPENADGIPRTEGRTIWLDHAKHSMELPTNEKDDKEVMRVPEVLKVGTLPLSPWRRRP
jgi:hypothetical protein